MNITLTGATGFIGTRLIRGLQSEGHAITALGRHAPEDSPGVRFVRWEGTGSEPPAEGLESADAIVHLAGEPVSQRWNAEVKKRIYDSRSEGTRHLVQALSTLRARPKTLVSASATGYYGDGGDQVLDESSAPGSGFLSEVCVEWEKQAQLAESLGIRVVMMRTGIVLGKEGGALKQMLTPFRLGVGGPLAGGRQWMSWIHVDDLVGMFRWTLNLDAVSGPINGTSPEPVRNQDFTVALGEAVHRPAVIPVPEFALKLLFGEMAGVMLASQRVLPKVPLDAGFKFLHPELKEALHSLNLRN